MILSFRILLLVICIGSVCQSWTPPITPLSARSSRLTASKENNSLDPASSGYSDDCFGLIFLSSTVGLNDAAFGGAFFLLSSAGAIGTQLERLPANPQVPAAVAGGSLLLAPILRSIITNIPVEQLPFDPIPRIAEAPWIELALCIFSMVYGFIIRKEEE